MIQKKNEPWKDITSLFNAAGIGAPKTEKQLRKIWERIKGKAKKQHAELKKESRRTDGGAPPKDVGEQTAKVFDIISGDLEDIGNCFDCDAITPAVSSHSDDLPVITINDSGTGVTYSEGQSSSAAELMYSRPTSSCSTYSGIIAPSTTIIAPPLAQNIDRSAGSAKRKPRHNTKFGQVEGSYTNSMKLHEKEHELDMKIKEAQLKEIEMNKEIKQAQQKELGVIKEINKAKLGGAQQFVLACESVRQMADTTCEMWKDAAIAVQVAAVAFGGRYCNK